MKRHFVIFGLALTLFWFPAFGANSVDEQVRKLGQRYSEVEAQLDRSIRYASRNDKGDSEQAWFNASDDLIKLAVESPEGGGRQLTEYFALDFENDYNGMFMLVRKETPAADGGMQVEESRKYFGTGKDGGNSLLIREQRKRANFKAGEPTDTVKTPNVVVDLSKKANQPTEEQLRQIFNAPTEMATELRKGKPELDPFANVKGDSDKYRVIRGTASPDGRFVIALGSKNETPDWDTLRDSDFPDEQAYQVEGDEARNYVVDVAQKKILGETGAAWAGTRRRYNHPEIIVSWSPDSSFFVQELANKWASDDCVAGKIATGPKFGGGANLMKTLTPKVFAFVKRHLDRDEYPLSFYNQKVGNDGAVEMKAAEYISGGERKGDTEFAVGVRLKLKETPKGLSIESVNMRRLPNEE